MTTKTTLYQYLTDILGEAFLQTMYMIIVPTIIATILGFILAIILVLTKPKGLKPNKYVYSVVGFVVNIVRSFPFIILLVAVIPFTRFLIGTSIGETAAIVPITIGAAPFIARIIENALNEVDEGLIEEVKIPMLDRGIYFGDGIYEATFSIGNKIFALDDHLDRLYSSASLLDINLPFTRTEIINILEELNSKVDSKVKFIYWQVTRGTAPRKHIYNKEIKGNLYITITPFAEVKDYEKKLKLITVEDTRFLHCNIKTLNLIPNVMASQKADEAGCDEAVFHRGDIVTEASHSNVHIIKDGVFKTHPTDNYILPGISRKHIIEICKNNNIKVDETAFTVKEMMEADEVLVTSSSKLIVPACEIDGIKVGGKAPNIVKLLQDEYYKKVDLETSL